MPPNKVKSAHKLPPVKKYLNLREIMRDLNALSYLVFQSSPSKLKKPVDFFEDADYGEDIVLNDTATKKVIPDLDKDDVIDEVKNPKPSKNVIKPNPPSKVKKGKITSPIPVDPPKGENTPAVVDKQTKEFEDQGSTFNYTDDNAGSSDDTSEPEGMELDDAGKTTLSKWNQELTVLFDQREKINNIINTLSHSFENAMDDPEKSIKSAILNAQIIQNKIKQSINELRVKISNSTETALPTKFRSFVNRVFSFMETKYNGGYDKASVIYQGGKNKNGTFQLSAFLVFVNFKDENKETLPFFIVGISVIGNSYYVNPSLLRLPSVGNFTPGYVIKNRNEAIRYIEEQLALYGNLDAISGVPVPPSLTNLGITAVKDVVDVKFTKYELIVKLKTVNNAKAIANELFSIIYSYLYNADPKATKRMKIRYDVFKKDGSAFVVFKFTKIDGVTGRTLQQDEIKILQNIFTEEDIHKIEYILNSKARKVA
jgi:hypothetical protein